MADWGPCFCTAKYDRAEAIQSILDPSARLTQGYIPVIIATNEGQVLSGLIQNETAMHVEIINANGKLIRRSGVGD